MVRLDPAGSDQRVGACWATASAATSRILRTLLPPNANAIASSRLTSSRGRGRERAAQPRQLFDWRGFRGERDGGQRGQGAEAPSYYMRPRDEHPGRTPASPRRQSSPPSCVRRGRSSRPAASMDAWIDTYHAVQRADAQRHVRLPDRQRRRTEGGRQPPAPRHQYRQRRAALERGAVPDVQAHAASTASRTPTARISTGSNRSSSSAATRASGRRAVSSTPGSCARTSAGIEPGLTLGGWANPHATAATRSAPPRRARQRRVLPDADRVAPQPARRRAVPRGSRPSRPVAAGTVRRLLLPLRQREDARHRSAASCRSRSTS